MILIRHIKATLLTILFVLHCHDFRAQKPGAIHATVTGDNIPLEFVNAAIYKLSDTAKVFKIASTDSTGRFTMNDLPAGKYILRLQLIGYLPERLLFELDSLNSEKTFNRIELKASGKTLDGIEIISHKDLIRKTSQGFVINAADNISQTGGTATDLLKNAPAVVVDPDGGITVRGKAPLILINGRNSSLGSTDRIPASSVESIEIITNPSAQYDADAEGGIINIKLKKNTARGTNGSVGLGAGYGAHGRLNSSLILNHQTGKWNFGLAYDNRFAGRTRNISANRTSYFLPQQYYLLQDRFDNRTEQTQNLRFNIDFNPNKKNAFTFELIGNMDGQDNDETLVSVFRTQSDSFHTKNSRESIEIGREKVAELAFGYNRKFDDKRRYLNVNLSSSFNFETENTNITTQSLSENDYTLGDPLVQRTYNYQNSSVSNFKIDYAHPAGKKGLLETGYKAIYRLTNADFQSQYFVNNEYVKNALASNIFNFQEQVHAAYLQYKNYTNNNDSVKWKYDVGLRAEQVYNEGKAVANSISVKRDYFNFFPVLNVSRNLRTNESLKLKIGRRINRPGLGQLNPFVDITDSLSRHGGNPYLKPELVNSAELAYSKDWKKISLTASGFYRYSTNIIRPYILLKSNGVALTTPMNYGNATTYGVEGIASFFLVKRWSCNASVSFYQQNIDGTNVNPDLANNVFSWYGKLVNNFTLWKDAKLQIITNYNSPVGNPQGKKLAVYYTDMGFQQKLFKGRGGLGLVITDVFNTQLNGYTASAPDFNYKRKSKIDTRAVSINFAWTFRSSFREDMIENKFSNE